MSKIINKITGLFPTQNGYKYREYESSTTIYGDSVSKDALVYVKNIGYVPIETLFKRLDRISFHNDGKEYFFPEKNEIEILTYDAENDDVCFRGVKRVMRHMYEKSLHRIGDTLFRTVDITDDHSIMTYDIKNNCLVKSTPKDFDRCFKHIIIPRKIPRAKQIQSKNFHSSVYEFLGAWLFDASHSRQRETSVVNPGFIYFGKKNNVDMGIEILDVLHKRGYITGKRKFDRGFEIYGNLCNILATDFFVKNKKVIPEWLINETDENIASFLRGAFTTRYYPSSGVYTLAIFHEHERDFVEIISLMLKYLGIAFSIVTKSNCYCAINIRDIKLFEEIVGFIFDDLKTAVCKNERVDLDDVCVTRHTTNLIIETYRDYVYDLEVEDTHTFFANDILVHNTDSVYIDLSTFFNTDAKQLDVVLLADKIGEHVNQSFPKFMSDVFNVPESRRDIIATEREVVSDKSLFLNKKKYVMHVVNNEGKIVDKMKIMGVEIKKSDTPVVIQRFLMSLVESIIDGKEFEDLQKLIDDFKGKYFKMSPFDIGTPTTIRNLTKYEEKLYLQGDMKGFPAHAKASLTYNAYKSSEDVPIVSGNKIKLIHVIHPDFETVAIPSEATALPKFLSGFDIDYQKHWENVWNKSEIYLTPIGMDIESRNNDLVNSLFGF